MKKFVILLTVLAMVLCLFAGCGSSDEDVAGSIVSTPAPTPSEEPAPTVEPESSEEPDPSEEPEPSEEPAPSEEPEQEFESGFIIGGSYTNGLLDISCTLGSDWMFYTEEQLAQLNGLVMDSFSDDDIREKMENSGVVYDMYATSLDGTKNVNIVFEDLGLVHGALLTEEAYADLSIEQLAPTLEAAGMTDVSCEATTVQFCGSEHAAINVTAKVSDIDLYETLVCMKAGKYMCCITFASYVENHCSEVMEFFYEGEPKEAPAEEAGGEQGFTMGTVNGNTYTNAFLGLKIELDDYWYIYDSAEMAQYNGLTSATMTDEEASALLLTNSYVDIMNADSLYDGSNFCIATEDLGLVNAAMTEQEYIDIVKDQLIASYEQSGYSIEDCSVIELNVGGDYHKAISLVITDGESTIYQCFVTYKIDRYMNVFTITVLEPEEVDAVLASIEKIN